MKIWQVDFYQHPPHPQAGGFLWELVICDLQGRIIQQSNCPQSQVNSDWLLSQLQAISPEDLPDIIQAFRPSTVSRLTSTAEKLGIKVEATRRTPALKKILKQRWRREAYNPVRLEQPPPQPLPENLWGEGWRFARFPAGEIADFFHDRPVPILSLPESLLPVRLGIASTLSVPGTVIEGGRKSLDIARWLAEIDPVALDYVPREIDRSGGLVLEAGLVDRWIVATFEDPEVAQSAANYEALKQASQGLHFLLVQPDSSGMTYSGFWLLRDEGI